MAYRPAAPVLVNLAKPTILDYVKQLVGCIGDPAALNPFLNGPFVASRQASDFLDHGRRQHSGVISVMVVL